MNNKYYKEYRKEDYEFWDLGNAPLKAKYDERQKKVQGIAYIIMLIILTIYYFTNCFLRFCGIDWANSLPEFLIGFCTAGFSGYAYMILKDAAIPYNQNSRYIKTRKFLYPLMLPLYFISIVADNEDWRPVIGGKLNDHYSFIYVFSLAFVLYFIFLFKTRKRKNEEKNDS